MIFKPTFVALQYQTWISNIIKNNQEISECKSCLPNVRFFLAWTSQTTFFSSRWRSWAATTSSSPPSSSRPCTRTPPLRRWTRPRTWAFPFPAWASNLQVQLFKTSVRRKLTQSALQQPCSAEHNKSFLVIVHRILGRCRPSKSRKKVSVFQLRHL